MPLSCLPILSLPLPSRDVSYLILWCHLPRLFMMTLILPSYDVSYPVFLWCCLSCLLMVSLILSSHDVSYVACSRWCLLSCPPMMSPILPPHDVTYLTFTWCLLFCLHIVSFTLPYHDVSHLAFSSWLLPYIFIMSLTLLSCDISCHAAPHDVSHSAFSWWLLPCLFIISLASISKNPFVLLSQNHFIQACYDVSYFTMISFTILTLSRPYLIFSWYLYLVFPWYRLLCLQVMYYMLAVILHFLPGRWVPAQHLHLLKHVFVSSSFASTTKQTVIIILTGAYPLQYIYRFFT